MYGLGVVALFPELITHHLQFGVSGRALDKKIAELNTWPIREEATDPHRTVDDRPYGGGPGMVLKCEPVISAIRKAKQAMPGCPLVYASPQGQTLCQSRLEAWIALPGVIFLAGRYEGIDERVLEQEVDEECSIGDYVLSGGELAVAVMMDALIRLLPGALHDPGSAMRDSFSGKNRWLDHPHYTRPAVFEGRAVPDVLLSGDHEAIERYRRQEAFRKTWQKRPDLVQSDHLSVEEKDWLQRWG